MKDQSRVSKPTRRLHEQQFKNDLIAQSLLPGASVAAIAMKAGINANLLFKWRREQGYRSARGTAPNSKLVPVCLIPDGDQVFPARPASLVAPAAVVSDVGSWLGVIEIEIAGAQLRLRGAVDEAMLGKVLRALRQTA